MSWQKSKNLVLAKTKLRMHLKYVTGQPLKYSPEHSWKFQVQFGFTANSYDQMRKSIQKS